VQKRILLIFFCIFISIQGLAKSNAASEIPITGWSKDPAIEQFDDRFTRFMKKWRMPGAAVTIMKDGKFVAQRGYGWADKDRKVVMQPDHLFRIASVSKTFTAVAIMKLIERGKLNLDDKAFDILDDLKPLPHQKINPKIKQITVRNLLQMSSGWFTRGPGKYDPMFGPWSGKIKNTLSPELPASCQTIARFMMSMPLIHAPGTQYAYSNTDYCLLGLIINKVTGSRYGYQGYEDYINQYMLYPLNIRDMFIASTQLKYKRLGEVTYYKDEKFASAEELANSFYLPYGKTELLMKNFANGGWVGSADDLAWFIQNLNRYQIITSKSLNFMKQKPSFRSAEAKHYYTVGGQIYHDKAGKQYWLQTGSFTGSNALVVTKPNGTTIAVIFNSRPSIYNFLSQFRPELRNIIINSNF
jgi:CubicO group peptidase (beta-lactamase class C family)